MFKQLQTKTIKAHRYYISYTGYYMFIPFIPDTYAYYLSRYKKEVFTIDEYVDQFPIDNSEQLDIMMDYAMDRKEKYAKWNLGNLLTGSAKEEEWIYYETV